MKREAARAVPVPSVGVVLANPMNDVGRLDLPLLAHLVGVAVIVREALCLEIYSQMLIPLSEAVQTLFPSRIIIETESLLSAIS